MTRDNKGAVISPNNFLSGPQNVTLRGYFFGENVLNVVLFVAT